MWVSKPTKLSRTQRSRLKNIWVLTVCLKICGLVSDGLVKNCFLCVVWNVPTWQSQLHACVDVISPNNLKAFRVSDLKTEHLNSESGRIHLLVPTLALSHKGT